MDTVAIVTGISIFFLVLFFLLHVLLFPETPIYPICLFYETFPTLYHFLILPHFFTILIGLFSFVCGYFINFLLVFALALFIPPIFWKDLRANLKSYRTFNKQRTMENVILEYRSVEIFHGIIMDFYGLLIIPYHTLLYLLVLAGSILVTRLVYK